MDLVFAELRDTRASGLGKLTLRRGALGLFAVRELVDVMRASWE